MAQASCTKDIFLKSFLNVTWVLDALSCKLDPIKCLAELPFKAIYFILDILVQTTCKGTFFLDQKSQLFVVLALWFPSVASCLTIIGIIAFGRKPLKQHHQGAIFLPFFLRFLGFCHCCCSFCCLGIFFLGKLPFTVAPFFAKYNRLTYTVLIVGSVPLLS